MAINVVRRASRRSTRAIIVGSLLGVALMSCGDDDAGGSTTSTAGGTTSTSPGGAPEISSFSVASPVTCDGAKAVAKVAYASKNVETFTVKIGNGAFEKTVGFGPRMDDAIVEIPCKGAAQSSVQLRGCNTSNQCVESASEPVSIVVATTTTQRATTTTQHATTTTARATTTTQRATTTTQGATTTAAASTTTTTG